MTDTGVGRATRGMTQLDDLDATFEKLEPACVCGSKAVGRYPPFGLLCDYDFFRIAYLMKTGEFLSKDEWKRRGAPTAPNEKTFKES